MGIKDDVRDQFSDEQVVTVAAVSTNSKQKKNVNQDLGIGCKEMGAVIRVDEAALGGGSLLVEIIEATNGALTAGVTAIASMTIQADQLVEGKSHFLELPGYAMTSKEFYGLRYTPQGGMTSVTLSSYFGARQDVANFKSFPSTYNVQN